MDATDFPKTPAMLALEAIHGRPVVDIIRERYEAGQTQREIADALGVNTATVHRYMRLMGLPARRFGWQRARGAS